MRMAVDEYTVHRTVYAASRDAVVPRRSSHNLAAGVRRTGAVPDDARRTSCASSRRDFGRRHAHQSGACGPADQATGTPARARSVSEFSRQLRAERGAARFTPEVSPHLENHRGSRLLCRNWSDRRHSAGAQRLQRLRRRRGRLCETICGALCDARHEHDDQQRRAAGAVQTGSTVLLQRHGERTFARRLRDFARSRPQGRQRTMAAGLFTRPRPSRLGRDIEPVLSAGRQARHRPHVDEHGDRPGRSGDRQFDAGIRPRAVHDTRATRAARSR
jgi:hypothetical protein